LAATATGPLAAAQKLDSIGVYNHLHTALAILFPAILAHGTFHCNQLAFGKVLIDGFALLSPQIDFPETGFVDPLVTFLAP
jgi:hypothetical protein